MKGNINAMETQNVEELREVISNKDYNTIFLYLNTLAQHQGITN